MGSSSATSEIARPCHRKSFSDAVRKVDPKARLIATGGDPDVFHDWNAAQLSNPANTFNYLSTHFVVTTNSVQAPHPSPDFIAKAAFALPIELERRLRVTEPVIKFLTVRIDEEQKRLAKIKAIPDWKKALRPEFWAKAGRRAGSML